MSSSPIALYLDFDSTLTVHDTLSSLSSLAPLHRPNHLPPLLPFETFTDAYIADLVAHDPPPPLARSDSCLEREIARLRSLRSVEDASLNRLEKAGWFRGLSAGHIKSGATDAVKKRDVELRRGWKELVRGVSTGAGSVVVVSVNWSRTWVGECLRAAAAHTSADGLDEREDVVRGIQIIANELEGLDDVSHGASGKIIGPHELGGDRLMSSSDKKRALDSLPHPSSVLRVYVGDSMTDLECLLGVDVGIVIRNGGEIAMMSTGQRELAEGLEKIGREVRWVGEYHGGTEKDEEHGGENVVWWARNFGEIADALIMNENREHG